MSGKTITDQVLAFAGLFQACGLVQQIARTGQMEQAPFEISIRSLFELNPASTEAVYGGGAGLRFGLKSLCEQLSVRRASDRNMELLKYTVAVMHLERQLAKRPAMLAQIGDGIGKARAQAGHFGSVTHENVIANLAGLYVDTISTLTPRIIVSGEQGHLSNPDAANRVRALLLAAIRSAVLWRQCGGQRWHLFLKRNNMLAEAERLRKLAGD